jgi:FkbM family methyltransferase
MSLVNINTSPLFTQYLIASNVFNEIPLMVVDVGARGGFEEHWSMYKDKVRLIGFEADVKECERLNKLEAGTGKRFYPVALHQNEGRKTFYATAFPPSAGFYQPDMKQVGRFPDKEHLTVVNTLDLNTISFDKFANDELINYVDFIKLDTEGSELDILKGALSTLKKTVLGLSIEIWFQSWHIGQPVFSDMDLFLRSLGFRLFGLDVCHRSRETLPEATSSPTKWGQVTAGESLYLRDAADEIVNENFLGSGWDDVKILKLASIMELFCLPDRDINQLADLLVSSKEGRIVSYNSYLKNVRKIKQRGYTNIIQRAKLLIPRGIRKVVGKWVMGS